jgi:endonuclease/exonuclease/phosphatase (EEP) superfamily protein YafD
MFLLFWPISLFFALLRLIGGFFLLASCLLTLTAFEGDRGWWWSLSTHFRVQYLVIQLIGVVAALWALRAGLSDKNRPWLFGVKLRLMVLLVFVVLNGSQIVPYYAFLFSRKPSEEPLAGSSVQLLHFNLFGKYNQDTHDVVTLVRATDPDLLDFVEYNDKWRKSLDAAGVLKRFPYRVVRSNIALYSKRPLLNARVTYTDPAHPVANQAYITTQIRLAQTPVTLIVAHPASPIAPSHWRWQQEMFEKWISLRRSLGKNLIVVGDLNTAPWSKEFTGLLQGTGLRDSELGFGLQPSWPMKLPFFKVYKPIPLLFPLRIPIDHVLVSDRIAVLARQTGPFVGSDHLPVLATLGLSATSIAMR